MDKLVEQYTPQVLANQKDIDAARKAFKAELRNGPTQLVSFSNGFQTFTRQQAFGNFDLDLYHKAYDADLSAAGLLDQFDDHGLVKRNSYAKFKLAVMNGAGECAKFAKELWVLQFGQSNYTLTNVPAAAKQLTPAEILNKLQEDKTMKSIFTYSVAGVDFKDGGKYNTCKEVFDSWFNTPENFEAFLAVTYLNRSSYEVIKQNICSMFLCIVAACMCVQKAQSDNKQFRGVVGITAWSLDSISVEFDRGSRAPVRIYFMFSGKPAGASNTVWRWIRFTLRFKLTESDTLLDMPTYAAVGTGQYCRGITVDLPEVKFSGITFGWLEHAAESNF